MFYQILFGYATGARRVLVGSVLARLTDAIFDGSPGTSGEIDFTRLVLSMLNLFVGC